MDRDNPQETPPKGRLSRGAEAPPLHRIRLPYDRKLIPLGHTEQDVRTFYYDETAARWRALERLAIDPDTQTVTSLTNHFTDMIAATVTVPDHPESLSYDPTTIKDIQSADPGAGINQIDPPQPSSHAR